jgi:hypothetical protein
MDMPFGFSSSDLYGSGASIGGNLSKPGGGGMFDPLSMGIMAGSSLLSGIFGGQQADRQAQAQIQAANIQAQATRDAAFQQLLGGQYALTGAKQFEKGLQENAANYQQAFLDPKKMSLSSEQFNRTVNDNMTPNAQKFLHMQNQDKLNQSLAERRAQTDAMFGQVAQNPFGYGQAPSYTYGA